jgi:hypothetical protein
MTKPWLQWMAVGGLLTAAIGCDMSSVAREASPGESAAPQSESAPSTTLPAEQSSATPLQPASADAQSTTASTAADAKSPAAVKLPDPDASGYIETTFDDLKFEMTKTELFDRAMLTPKVNALMGKKIRIRGYIFPTLRKTGLDRIVLVRDNMECCFGPGAALFDCILVTMAPGKTAEYTIRPVAVEGEIRLEELQGGPDGRPLAIYQMVGHKVE